MSAKYYNHIFRQGKENCCLSQYTRILKVLCYLDQNNLGSVKIRFDFCFNEYMKYVCKLTERLKN